MIDITKQNHHVELAEKVDRLNRLMDEHALDALVLSRHENIAWATAGLVDLRIGVPRETGAGCLLYTRAGKTFYLTTNNEYPRQSKEEFSELDYEPIINPWYANDIPATIAKTANHGKVGSDMPIAGTTVVNIAPYRFQLTEGEIERYRWLGRTAAEAATEVVHAIRPGITETEMQTLLGAALLSRNLMPSVYLTAVDDRVRNYRHAVPRAGVLDRFGMVNFCARRWGLSVSMTRFVHFGPMPQELADKFAAVAIVHAKLQAATRVGKTADELFHVAKNAYAAEGYPHEETMHHQGGASGYAEREWLARPGGTEKVQDRQAFAWNPTLQGGKVEDTILVLDGKIELLTPTPELPVVETSAEGVVVPSAGVLMK